MLTNPNKPNKPNKPEQTRTNQQRCLLQLQLLLRKSLSRQRHSAKYVATPANPCRSTPRIGCAMCPVAL